MVQCDNDGDTSIVRVALIEATGDSSEVNTIFIIKFASTVESL